MKSISRLQRRDLKGQVHKVRQPRRRIVVITQRIGYALGMGRLTDAISEAVRASDQSAYAIAKGSGVARSQLSRMMRGQSGMNVDSVERLADYLELEIVIRPKRRTRKAK